MAALLVRHAAFFSLPKAIYFPATSSAGDVVLSTSQQRLPQGALRYHQTIFLGCNRNIRKDKF